MKKNLDLYLHPCLFHDKTYKEQTKGIAMRKLLLEIIETLKQLAVEIAHAVKGVAS